jgi:ABC-type nitrate/sulfonate/bicarbonate transport system permease component
MATTTIGNRRLAGRRVSVRAAIGSRRSGRILSVVVFLLAWHLIVPILPTILIPDPLRVARFMWDELRGDTLAPHTVYQAFGISLQRLAIGLALAVLIGVPIGLLVGLFRSAEAFLHDFVVVGLAMPSLIWALLAGMWWGLGDRPAIIVVVLAAVTFVIINVAEGVRDVPKRLLDMGAAYDVPRSRVIRHVILPSLMPFFFAALRYGLANGWKGLVLAEVFAGTDGAGWTIRYWYDAHRAHGVIGYALFFVIFALVVERLLFGRLSAYVFRWRPRTALRTDQ